MTKTNALCILVKPGNISHCFSNSTYVRIQLKGGNLRRISTSTIFLILALHSLAWNAGHLLICNADYLNSSTKHRNQLRELLTISNNQFKRDRTTSMVVS